MHVFCSDNWSCTFWEKLFHMNGQVNEQNFVILNECLFKITLQKGLYYYPIFELGPGESRSTLFGGLDSVWELDNNA